MKKHIKDQKGKLSIEQIAWIVIALIVIALGATVAVSTMGNKSSNATKLLTKDTLVCPADSMSLDVRQYVPAGVPISTLTTGGAITGGPTGMTIIPKSPYIDMNSDGTTAEFVCITNAVGY